MSEPEISRRCSSCGASIRERAFFCPQCGLSLGGDEPALETAPLATQPLMEITKSRKNTPGVEKKERHIASVVLNEVAYDPSLRFVLIAALLFLIFLVIVIMSKVIT